MQTEISSHPTPYTVDVETSSEVQGYRFVGKPAPLIDFREELRNLFDFRHPLEKKEDMERGLRFFRENSAKILEEVPRVPIYSHKAKVHVEAVCQHCGTTFSYNYELSFSEQEFKNIQEMFHLDIKKYVLRQMPKPQSCTSCGYYNTWSSKNIVLDTWKKLLRLTLILVLVGPITLGTIAYFAWADASSTQLLQILKWSLICALPWVLFLFGYAGSIHRENQFFRDFKPNRARIGGGLWVALVIVTFVVGLFGAAISKSMFIGVVIGSWIFAIIYPVLLLRFAAK